MDEKKHNSIIWNGVVFQPTGYGSYARGLLRAAKDLTKVQILDFYNSVYDADGQLKECFSPVDSKDGPGVSVLYQHPNFWSCPNPLNVGLVLWEGDWVHPQWVQSINGGVQRLIVPSQASKNLFFSNGVRNKISVVNGGVDSKKFSPGSAEIPGVDWTKLGFEKKPFIFLYLNYWTGEENCRKGGDKVIRAFCNEFKKGEQVVLFFKNSTFWRPPYDFEAAVRKLGVPMEDKRPPIVWNYDLLFEDLMPDVYRSADCFVSASNGESWGLTILEAMATGLPVIVPKNRESGYMDFLLDDGTFWVDVGLKESGDPMFYPPENKFPVVSVDSLKQQMRKAFELSKSEPLALAEMGLKNRLKATEFSWEKAALQLVSAIDGVTQ